MHRYVRLKVATPCFVLALAACRSSDHGAVPSPSSSVASRADAQAPAPSVIPSSAAPVVDASAPPPDAAIAASGSATLVVQKVYAQCGVGEWSETKEPVHYLGTDLFVLVQSADPQDKPRKEFVFCSSRGADGGVKKPQLQIWQNCSAFPACKVLSSDARHENRVEVQCGKENVVIESDGTHTFIRGSFGERELAPHPTTIGPPKSEVRKAMVDC